MTVFEAKNLSLVRGGRELFRGMDIEAGPGTIVAVIGPNGAGKSSLLMALAAVLVPASGECIMQGRAVSSYSRAELAQLIAWQGELPPTEFGLTVEQRLKLAAMGSGDAGLMHHAIKEMDIGTLLSRSLAELSSGERQRVEIASVMLRDCPLWLFDEPTSHLDLQHQVACLNMFRAEARKGRVIVTVLHDIQQAASVADKVILIDGRGGIECGDARSMMVTDKLESLFRVKLATVSLDGREVQLPDYRGHKDTGEQ
ncbi:MAG: ATP-binding cassette domain-containing protein [Mariprofundaceae bacterium]|nr:ATP-binding cassette domain-containing protein [Mariprofundaceae bacterium]